jgi:Bacterial protein of unknown function (DUF899)
VSAIASSADAPADFIDRRQVVYSQFPLKSRRPASQCLPCPSNAPLKARMGWAMPWYTITDSFDADSSVDEWHGHNVIFRGSDKVYRTYFINWRGDESMGTTWSYLDVTPLGRQRDLGGLVGGLPPDSALQMVELARQLRR